MKFTCTYMAVLVGALVALSVPACGDYILIDFGPAAAGSYTNFDGTHYWNNVGGNETITSLRDSQNTLSGVQLSVAGATGVNTWNAGETPDPNLNGGLFAFDSVTRDGLYNNAGVTASVTLSNLSISATYNLVLYGSRQDFERYTTYTVGAQSVELQTGYTTGTGFNSNHVVSLSGLAPDANGVITMTFNGNAAPGGAGATAFSYLNAMEIQVVPEPGTLGFALLGGCMAWRFRRWRS